MKSNTSLLVALQLLFIFLFLISGPLLAVNIYLLVVELLAGVLGVWAIIHMVRRSKFSGRPEPAEHAQLLETGPYQYIRNPMYTAILLALAALTLDYFTWLRLLLLILEAVVLLKKISIEEILLTEKFKGYKDYKKRSCRLVPFIY